MNPTELSNSVALALALAVATALTACHGTGTSDSSDGAASTHSSLGTATAVLKNDQQQHRSRPETVDEIFPEYEDPLEFNPSLWTRQVAFRDSFKTCWRNAETATTRSTCIVPEMAYQLELIRKSSDALRALLSDDEWQMLQEDLGRLPSADDGTCDVDADPSKSNADGAEFCRIYRKALLANYLQVQLALQADNNKD